MAKSEFLDRGGVSNLIGNINGRFTDFKGATSESNGEHGLVPAPAASEDNLALCSDGTWKNVNILLQNTSPDNPKDFGMAESWETVKAWADDCANGNIDNYRTLVQNGAVKSFFLPGYGDIDMQLCALNNKDRSDGHGKAGFLFMSVDLLVTHQMNSTDTSGIYWEQCYGRTSILNESGDIFQSIPNEIKDNLLKVNNVCAISAATSSGSAPDTKILEDTLFIPSYTEIFGEVSSSFIKNPPVEGTQFDYFVTRGYSQYLIKKILSRREDSYWWLRTPIVTGQNRPGFFVITTYGGQQIYNMAASSTGVVMCFCF